MRSVPLTREDRAVVLSLLRAMDLVEAGRTVTTDTEARALLEDPGTDPVTDGVVLHDEGGTAVGFAIVRPVLAQRRIRVTLGVEPTSLASTAHDLLAWATARADSMTDERGWGDAEIETWQLPDALLSPLLQERGWRTDRRFCRLHGATGPRPSAPAPRDVLLEAGFTGQRAAAVHGVLESALAEHWNHRPRPLSRFLQEEQEADGFDPDLWYLATADGRPAGALIGRRPGGDGWIAALGALAPFRGRGIGRLLLSAVLVDLADRGAATVELDVDTGNTSGALRLYDGFGLLPRYQVDRWVAPVAARRGPGTRRD